MDLIGPQALRFGEYEVRAVALDERCSAVRVEAQRAEARFEETIYVYDFVDIKPMLKAGRSMDELTKLSLLFLKLMVGVAGSNGLKIAQLHDLPLRKILRSRQDAEKWLQAKGEEAKGLLLQLREDLFLVLPRLLVDPHRTQHEPASQAKAALFRAEG